MKFNITLTNQVQHYLVHLAEGDVCFGTLNPRLLIKRVMLFLQERNDDFPIK